MALSTRELGGPFVFRFPGRHVFPCDMGLEQLWVVSLCRPVGIPRQSPLQQHELVTCEAGQRIRSKPGIAIWKILEAF